MTTDLVIIDSMPSQPLADVLPPDRLSGIIMAWLAEPHSERTRQTYGAMVADFREHIRATGYDLDAPAKKVAYAAQSFAQRPQRGRYPGDPRVGAPVTKSTHNLRLAAVSSFYGYAINHDELPSPNPLDRVKRHKREDYQGAKTLPFADGEISAALAAIPNTANGLRDRALLLLTLYTGRRLAEVASLTCGDITYTASQMIVEWQHLKGNKTGRNKIASSSPVYVALLAWLRSHYGRGAWPPDALVFMSLSRNSYGHQLTAQGIEQRAARWLPIGKAGAKGGKFHALRHTFAASMLASGATIQELSEALGHSSLAVTSNYVHKLTSGENVYMDAMEDVYAGRARQRKTSQ